MFRKSIALLALLSAPVFAADYYTASGSPAANSSLSSSTLRTEYSSIATGFTKVAPYTGNGDKFVVINSGGTAQTTASAATARSLLSLVIGTNVQAWDADLDALAALDATAGMVSRTGAGAFAVRTITGTASEIDVANGTGASANPTLSLPASLAFTGKTIAGGTFSSTTLTAPAINGIVTTTGLTLPALTLGGTITSNGQSFSGTIANLGTVTTADINGGTIDGAAIGASSASTGSFTTLSTSGNATLGDATTDTVLVNGYAGIGGAGASTVGLNVVNSALTGAIQYGIAANPTGTSSATNQINGLWAGAGTANSAFTVTNLSHIRVGNLTKGAASTIINQYGLIVEDQTQGTNNFGVTSQVSSGSNKWNIYASGTASNYFAGNVGIGTTSPVSKLSVLGESAFAGGASVGIGYAGTAAPSNGLIIQGNVGIGTTSPFSRLSVTGAGTGTGRGFSVADSSNVDNFYVLDNGTAYMRGNVGIGTSGETTYSKNAVSDLSISKTEVWTTASLKSYVNLAAGSGLLVLGKSRGTTIGTQTVTQNGDTLGYISAEGVNSSSAARWAAAIQFTQDGAAGATFLPGKINFRTGTASADVSTAMVIDSTGNVGIGTTTPAEVLDVVGNIKTSGDLAINGGDLTSSATTFNLLNATVTTLNIGGAATTLAIGASTVSAGLGVAASSSAFFALPAATTAKSTIRIPHGSAPTSPVNGDMWTTTAGLFVRINGATVGPLN